MPANNGNYWFHRWAAWSTEKSCYVNIDGEPLVCSFCVSHECVLMTQLQPDKILTSCENCQHKLRAAIAEPPPKELCKETYYGIPCQCSSTRHRLYESRR